MSKIDTSGLEGLANNEDFLDDLNRDFVPYSDDEFLDKEFNKGIEEARTAIIERINPKAILAALGEAEKAKRDFADILTSHGIHSQYWFKRAREAEIKLTGRPDFIVEAFDEGLREKLIAYLAPPLGSADRKFLIPDAVTELEEFLEENDLKIVRIVDDDS